MQPEEKEVAVSLNSLRTHEGTLQEIIIRRKPLLILGGNSLFVCEAAL